MAREAIRTLRVTVQEQGAAKTAASIEHVGDAVADAGAKIQGFSRVVDRELKKGMVGAEVATDGLEKKTRVLTRSVEGLQRSLDPAYRATQQLAKVERDLGLARDQNLISLGRHNELLGLAQEKYMGTANSAAAANTNIKLTTGQVQNLGYQLNDVATMLAMGASPFQVISSQAGQVVQSLGDGPGGMMGSLKAIGSSILGLTRFINPMTIGLTAAAGAVAYFALRSSAAEKSTEANKKAVEAYTGALKNMRTAAGDAGAAANAIFERQTTLSATAARAQLLKATEAQRQARSDATEAAISRVGPVSGTIDGLQSVLQRTFDGDYSRFIGQMEDIVSELSRGKITATEFQDEIAAIRTNPLLPDSLKAIADGLSEDANSAREAEARVKALTGAVQELGYEAARLKLDDLRSNLESMAPKQTTATQDLVRMNNEAMRELGKLDPTRNSPRAIEGMALDIQRTASKAFDELSRSALEAAQDAQAALSDVDASPLQRQINQVTREYERQREEAERTNGSAVTLSALREKKEAEVGALVKENTRAEEARRAGYQLDLQAIGVRDAATKASIDAERTRIELISQGYSAADADARAAEARSLSLAQSTQAETESLRQRNEARTDALAGLQLETQTLGKTAGETARLTAEFGLLQEAKKAAYSEGRDVTTAETDAIKQQAAAVGELTQALAEQKLAQEISDERRMIGLSDKERSIQQQLKSSGLDAASASGEYYAAQMRVNDALQESHDLAKDFVETLVGGLSSGEGALKSLTSAFAGLGQKMASNGLNMLFDSVMGGGGGASKAGSGSLAGTLSSIGNLLSGKPAAANSNSAAATSVSAVSSPVSKQLAETVTKSVSGNLLSSLLGAGKGASHISNLNTSFATALTSMFEAAPSAVKSAVQINSGFRSIARQGELFDAAVQKYGSVSAARKWVAPPGKSQHNFGNAADLGYSSGAAKDWFHENAGKYGLAFPLGNEDWHIELASARGGKAGAGASGSANVDARAVADGVEIFAKKSASGSIPGVAGASRASAGASASGGATVQMQEVKAASGLGQGMEALGAGLGIFANAYQGGSPVGGAVSGALGGWSAGAAIAGVGGPVGAVVGGIVGLIGGIFGGKSQKKKEAQQRDIEAGKAWEAAFPKLIELSDYVDMEEKGSLSQELADIEKQLVEFRKLAVAQGKEKGHKDAINNVATVTAQAKTYGDRLKAELRGVAGTRSEELAGGLGLDTDFEKARTSIKETSKQYLGYISDVKLAFAVPDDQTGAINAAYDKSKSAIEAAEKAKKEATGTAAAALARSKLVDEAVKSGNASILKPGNSDGQLAAAAAKRDAELAAYNKSVEGALERYNNAVAEAYSAARAGLLAIVSGNIDKPTDVEAALDQARGAAVAMQYALQDLGMSADDAAKAIDGALTTRIKSMGEAFQQDLQDSIDGLDGKGYLADFRELIKGIVDTRSDASLLNVDTSLVDTFFAKQAQALVDGSELTGDAFAELIKAFPSLSGVVHEFSDVIVSTAAEIADRMQGYGDRLFAATNDNTSLAGTLAAFDRQANYDREAEAKSGGAAMVELEKALAAERLKAINDWAGISLSQKLADATAKRSEAEEDLRSAYDKSSDEMQNTIDRLKGLRDSMTDFLTSIRLDDEKSPLSGFDQVTKAQQDFRDIQAKALAGDEEAQGKLIDVSQSYLDEARDYYASSEAYFAIFNEVEAALKSADVKAGSQLTQTEQQLAEMKTQVSSLISIDTGVKTVAEAIAALSAAIAKQQAAQAAVGGGRSFGVNPVRNQLIDQGFKDAGLSFSGNYGVQADGSAPLIDWLNSLSAADYAKSQAVIGQYIGINRQTGGLIPGYVNGGMVGNGTWNKDSVIARYAGGGSIGLAGGEMVISAPKVTPQTYPVLQEINRTGRVPANGDGNGALIAEVRMLRDEVRSLKQVSAEGFMLNAAKLDEGNGHSKSQASEQKKRNAA